MQTNTSGRTRLLVTSRLAFALASALLILSPAISAQTGANTPATAAPSSMTPVSTPSVTPPVPATSGLVLPANTVVELEMVDALSSKTSKHDDLFKLRVAADLKSGNTVLVAAGTPVVGQVVHAEKSHGGGKPGELIIAARYIELPQGQIKLHSSFGAAGKDRSGASMATSIAFGVFGFFVKGKEIEIPAGSALSARIAADTPIVASP